MIIVATISAAWLFGASPYMDSFLEAARAYESGDYATAIQHYEQLIREDVVEPAVFYNLANAYYRLGHLGPAIANYERALALEPTHQKARDNLNATLQEIRRNLGRPAPPEWESSLFFWHYGMSLTTALWLAVLSWFAFWVLLALRRWKPLPYLRGITVGVAILSIAFAGSAWSKSRPSALAVASRPSVVVRYLPQENDPARFELYEGDRVRVADEREGWLLVETASGERGWAPVDAFTLVGPPYRPFVGTLRLDDVPEDVEMTGT